VTRVKRPGFHRGSVLPRLWWSRRTAHVVRRRRRLALSCALGAVGTAAVVVGATGSATATGPTVARNELPSNAMLRAFLRPRQERDQMPTLLAESVRGLAGEASVPDVFRNGAVDATESRLLLAGVGPANGGLYAFPSARGRICYALDGGPQSCHSRFSADHPVGITLYDADGFNRGAAPGIFGLVPNNVVRIDIVIDGRSYPARLGENAYHLELPTAQWTALDVAATFRSGSSVRTPVPTLGPP
jgi:hypothetical protein